MQSEQEQSPNTHLFTVRLWQEHLGDASSEIRCQVHHVGSGETRHFRDWSRLVEYLTSKLDKLDPQLR